VTHDPRSPRTEAGKRLVTIWGGAQIDLICEIEREAAAARSGEGLRETLERIVERHAGHESISEQELLADLRAALAAAPRQASEE
jgi:hypothetical protein